MYLTETSEAIEYFNFRVDLDNLEIAIDKFQTFEEGSVYALNKSVLDSAVKSKVQCVKDLNENVKKRIEESESSLEQNNF